MNVSRELPFPQKMKKDVLLAARRIAKRQACKNAWFFV